MNKDIFLEDGSTLKWFAKKYDHFLNRTTIIYGRRESGKSTIVIEIMFICKDHISIPVVISQSSVSNSDFDGVVPGICIKSDVNKDWLEKFLLRQKGRAMIYRTANDPAVLKALFNRVQSKRARAIEERIFCAGGARIAAIENSRKLDYAAKRAHTSDVLKIQVNTLLDLYRTTIRAYRTVLEKEQQSLPKEELCCLNFLDFKPHAMLVVDDCAAAFKKWVKESTVLKEIFYNGRHYYITIIITAQDDKEIDSELRKNSMVSIFTTNQAATANFMRASNAYPKNEKVRAEQCIRRIFNEDGGQLNFKKLVYLQNNTGEPFYYTIADICEEFKVGCAGTWDLDKKMAEKRSEHTSAELESFFNKYHNI